MRFITAAIAAAAFSASVSGLNIVLGNDDGAFSANIRETYRLLKEEGHYVLLVASADNQSVLSLSDIAHQPVGQRLTSHISGKGGLFVFTSNNTLERPSDYDIIPDGAPSLGTDPADSHIWYYNDTPAACLFVALD